jgi:hypothetical protein
MIDGVGVVRLVAAFLSRDFCVPTSGWISLWWTTSDGRDRTNLVQTLVGAGLILCYVRDGWMGVAS